MADTRYGAFLQRRRFRGCHVKRLYAHSMRQRQWQYVTRVNGKSIGRNKFLQHIAVAWSPFALFNRKSTNKRDSGRWLRHGILLVGWGPGTSARPKARGFALAIFMIALLILLRSCSASA